MNITVYRKEKDRTSLVGKKKSGFLSLFIFLFGTQHVPVCLAAVCSPVTKSWPQVCRWTYVCHFTILQVFLSPSPAGWVQNAQRWAQALGAGRTPREKEPELPLGEERSRRAIGLGTLI